MARLGLGLSQKNQSEQSLKQRAYLYQRRGTDFASTCWRWIEFRNQVREMRARDVSLRIFGARKIKRRKHGEEKRLAERSGETRCERETDVGEVAFDQRTESEGRRSAPGGGRTDPSATDPGSGDR